MKIELPIDQDSGDPAEHTKQRWSCDTCKGYYEVKQRRFGPHSTKAHYTVLMIDKVKNQVIYQDIDKDLQALLERVLADTGDELNLLNESLDVVAQPESLTAHDQNMTLKAED